MSVPSTRLLVVVINDPERLDEVLAGLLDLGVTGATILDSEGMGRILPRDTPVFAGLRGAVVDRPRNATILSVVEEGRVDAVLERVQEVLGDLTAPSTGIAFVLPVERVVGLAPALEKAQDRGEEPQPA
jgi:nitrogen regulatory protein P-II 1